MGQRANLVILRDGAWTLYYDHWCANRIDTDLFWGPEHAEAFITQREPRDQKAWLDEVWFEGGAIVDFDRLQLHFCGGEDIDNDIPNRWAALALMREVWSGWRITYALQGIVDLADYLGVPRSTVLLDRGPDDYDKFQNVSSFTTGGELLLTFKRNGAVGANRVFGTAVALQRGLEHILPFVVHGPSDVLCWGADHLHGGVHLDFDNQRLATWWSQPVPAIVARLATAWPGWSIDWLRDDYRLHRQVAGVDVQFDEPDWPRLQRDHIAKLRTSAIREGENLALRIAEQLATEGASDIEVNPMTGFARGSIISPEQMTAILDRLEASLPVHVTGP